MDNVMEVMLEGLNCPHCAGKIEEKVKKAEHITEATLNFISKELTVYIDDEENREKVYNDIVRIVNETEDGVNVYEKKKMAEEAIEEEEDNTKFKAVMIGISIAFFVSGLISGVKSLFVVSYIVVGYEVLFKSVKNILKGRIFDENFLMSVASIGAFVLNDFAEAAAVMLFYQVGETLQDMAVDKSRRSVKALINIMPEYANIFENGETRKAAPEEIKAGDIIVIKAGEKIPLDGVVTEGSSFVDMSTLTGESLPVEIGEGDEVLSGSINNTGIIKVKVTREYTDSTVAKLLELVERSGSKKAKSEKFITRFAGKYTMTVVFAAIAIAIIPNIITGWENAGIWVHRALTFLVASCPCALVVSIPLGFFSGIGEASRRGILIKGGNYLELLADVGTVVFDKTGTLTKGVFSAKRSTVYDKNVLAGVYAAEKYSNHPVAKAFVNEFSEYESKESKVQNIKEEKGYGMTVDHDGKVLAIGNERLMKKLGIKCDETDESGTVLHIGYDGRYSGYIVFSDIIKENAKKAVDLLEKIGVYETVMLTGDKKKTAEDVGESIGIKKIYSELLPENKVEKIEEIMKGNERKTIFVGDGINDAPVIAISDIGAAMGGLGSDAAIEAADVVIMNDDIEKIAEAIELSKNTMKIIKENIIFVMGVKIIVLLLAAFGISNMWLAVFADVGVALIAIFNSMREKM